MTGLKYMVAVYVGDGEPETKSFAETDGVLKFLQKHKNQTALAKVYDISGLRPEIIELNSVADIVVRWTPKRRPTDAKLDAPFNSSHEGETDKYCLRAAQEYGVPYADVTHRQRQAAKTREFYDIYGGPPPVSAKSKVAEKVVRIHDSVFYDTELTLTGRTKTHASECKELADKALEQQATLNPFKPHRIFKK